MSILARVRRKARKMKPIKEVIAKLPKRVQEHIKNLERRLEEKEQFIEDRKENKKSKIYWGCLLRDLALTYIPENETVYFQMSDHDLDTISIRFRYGMLDINGATPGGLEIVPNASNSFYVKPAETRGETK